MEEKRDQSFVIRDKRIFDETGDVRKEEDSAPDVKTETRPVEPQAESEQRPPVTESPESGGDEAFPEVNFVNFILSLSTTAMYHFGDFPDPVSQKAQRNLAAAK